MYKCNSGNGIGLSHSAVVSNLLFYEHVESRCVPPAHGLQQWVRYHDDIIAVFRDRRCATAFFSVFKSFAKPVFKVICEGVYSVGKPVEFLDMTLCISPPLIAIEATQAKPIIPLC